MDGVLYQGTSRWRPTPPFRRIKDQGLRVIMATNNAIRNTDEHLEKMKSFGVDLEPWQIINSIQVVIALLKRNFPEGGPIYGVVSPSTMSSLEAAGYYNDEKDAQAVVVGLDRNLTYENWKRQPF